MIGVSVIIACLNGAETINEAIESLITQQVDFKWEIILADNGSTDGTNQIFMDWANAYPDIQMRIIDGTGELGKSHCLNVAIPQAQSDQILFLDADDAVAPGWLRAMVNAMKDHDFVACRAEHARLNKPEIMRIRTESAAQTRPLRIRHAPYCFHACGGMIGFHRRVFDAVGGFNPEFAALEDNDFCIRAYLNGYKLFFVQDAFCHYRFRTEHRGIYRQSYSYAKFDALLRKKYDPGNSVWSPSAWLFGGFRVGYCQIKYWSCKIFEAENITKLGILGNRLGLAKGDLAGAFAFGVAPLPIVPFGPNSKIIEALRNIRSLALVRFFPSVISVATLGKTVALVFCGLDSPETIAEIRALAAGLGISTTFFVSSAVACLHPELVRSIQVDGHEVGIESREARLLGRQSMPFWAGNRIKPPDGLFPSGIKLLRLPGGRQRKRTKLLARQMGYKIVHGTARSIEDAWYDVETIAKQIKDAVRPGSILVLQADQLFRDEHGLRIPDVRMEALLLAVGEKQGFQFVTVSQLLTMGKVRNRYIRWG